MSEIRADLTTRLFRYHVVTLTWRLHFPQYPKAHIPKLRLAPHWNGKKRPAGSSNPYRARVAYSRSIEDLPADSDRRLELGIPQKEPRRYYQTPVRFDRPTKRRRPNKRQDEFISPSIHLDEAAMEDFWLRLRERSEWEAKVTEFTRRHQFWQVMKPHWQLRWSNMFAATKSLLSLGDRIQTSKPSY